MAHSVDVAVGSSQPLEQSYDSVNTCRSSKLAWTYTAFSTREGACQTPSPPLQTPSHRK